jgi:hypothetical protein
VFGQANILPLPPGIGAAKALPYNVIRAAPSWEFVSEHNSREISQRVR